MSTTSHRTFIATSATAIATVGLLAAPVPALADPPCNNFGWPGAVTLTEQGADQWTYTFTSTGPTATGPATIGGLRAMVTGGITGRQISLKFAIDKGQQNPIGYDVWELGGEVQSDDIGRGSSLNRKQWETNTKLVCLDVGANQGGGNGQGGDNGQGGAAPAGMAKVLGDVDMYEEPGGVGSPLPGFLDDKDGTATVKLITCRDDNWCNVDAPGVGPVWVWGQFIEH
jgi:hypothetical protein